MLTSSFLYACYFQENQDLLSFLIIIVFVLILLVIILLMIIGLWRIFQKADRLGWASLVPIYNLIVILQITGRPVWYLVLMLIPGAQIILWAIIARHMARVFEKGWGFALGLFLMPFIFIPILGMGKSTYISPYFGL